MVDIQQISCANCGAPLDYKGKETFVTCKYCGYQNEISTAKEQMDKLIEETKKWLEQFYIVGSSTIDVGMRALYFKDKIFPELVGEFTEIVGERIELVDYPIVGSPIFNVIEYLKPDVKWEISDSKSFEDFAFKLKNPEINGFATTEKAKSLLKALEFRCYHIPATQNILTLSHTNDIQNLELLMQNLDRISNVAKEIAENFSGNERTLYEVYSRRYEIGKDLVKSLITKIKAHDTFNDDEIDKYVQKTQELLSEMENTSDISVVDKVAIEQGLRYDIDAYRVHSSIVSLYSIYKKSYDMFVNSFGEYLRNTLIFPPKTSTLKNIFGMSRAEVPEWFTDSYDLSKISWFSMTLKKIFKQKTAKLAGFDYAQQLIKKRFRGEHFIFLYPFYFLKVKAILKSGFLFWQKANDYEFYTLVDGTFNQLTHSFLNLDFAIFTSPGFKKALKSKEGKNVQYLINVRESTFDPSYTIIPPSVTPEDAENLYRYAYILKEDEYITQRKDETLGTAFSKFITKKLKDLGDQLTQGMFNISGTFARKGFDAEEVKGVIPEVIDIIYIPFIADNKRAMLAGKEYGLDEIEQRVEVINKYIKFSRQ